MRIKGDGRVGIGTSSPYAKLTVWGAGTGSDQLVNFVNSASTTIFTALENGNIGIGSSTPGSLFAVGNSFAINSSGQIINGDWQGTAIANTKGGTGIDSSGLTGLAQIVGGTWSASSTVSVAYGGTGATNFAANGILYGNDNGAIQATAAGANNYILYSNNGVPTWGSTSTLGILGSNLTAGLTAGYLPYYTSGSVFGNSGLYYNGTYLGIGTTSPQAALHIGTASSSSLTRLGDSVMISGELEVLGNTYIGGMQFPEDGGMMTWMDMPVTLAAAGTPQGYTARIDNYELLTLYSEADGAGDIMNPKVGIGTSTPYGVLSVYASSTYPAFVVQATSTGGIVGPIASFFGGATELVRIDNMGRLGIGTTSPTTSLSVQGTAGAPVLNIASSTGASLLYVAANGNVGIGTTDPGSYKLNVNGTLKVNGGLDMIGGDAVRWFSSGGGTTGAQIQGGGSGGANSYISIGTNYTSRLYINHDGNIGIGTTSPYAKLTVWGNGTGSNQLVNFVNSASTTIFTALENGNIGIGSSTPGSLFTVGNSFAVNSSGQVINGEWQGTAIANTKGGTGQNSSGWTGLTQVVGGVWSSTSTVSVTYGGTGATSFTTNGILYGNGSGPIQATAAGASGNILYSNAGTPAWGDPSTLGLMASTTISLGTAGYIPYYTDSSRSLTATSAIYIDTDGSIGLGNTSPSYRFDLNSALDTNLFRLAYNGSDIITVTDAQTTINNTLSIAGVGDVSVANDILMTSSDSGAIKFQGPGYLMTDSSWQDLDLTLSAANQGFVVVDDTLQIVHTEATTTAGNYYGLTSDFTADGVFTADTTNVYGVYGKGSATGMSTGGTINVYGGYFEALGTSTPVNTVNTYGLFVNGATGGDNNYSAIFQNGNVGIGTTSPLTKLSVQGTAGQPILNIASSTGESLFYVAESGNVGIGTINPETKLYVSGGGTFMGGISAWGNPHAITLSDYLGGAMGYVSTDYSGVGIISDANSGGNAYLFGSSHTGLLINAFGNAGIGTSSPYAKLTVWGAGTGSDQLVNFVNSASTTIFTALENGNIGIGSSTPGSLFAVGNSFAINSSGQIINGDWQGTAIANTKGGTGQDSSGWTGFAYVNGGAWSASSTLGINALPTAVMTEGENISLLNNNSNFIALTNLYGDSPISYNNTTGHFSVESGYAIPLTASSTNWNNTYNTVNANSGNWDTAYGWGNHATEGYFSTTTDQILSVQYGGTGSSTLAVNGLLYGNGTGAVGTTGQGANGYILQANASGIPTWVSTTTLGFDTGFGTVNSGTTGYFPYYAADGTAVTATSSLYINTAGNIGIGTTSPLAKLDITAFSNQLRLSNGTANYALFDVNGSGYLAIKPTSGYSTFNAAGIQNYLQVYDSTGADYIQLTHDGTNAQISTNAGSLEIGSTGDIIIDNGIKLGIGTSSPSARLTVWGDGTGSSQLVHFVNSASTSLFTVLENGWIGIGTSSPLAVLSVQGTAGAPVLNIASSTGASLIYVAGNGNIGFGTMNPNNTIQVKDLINFNNSTNGTFIGYQAGALNDASANNNTYIGYQAGRIQESWISDDNTVVGANAMYSSQYVYDSTVLGSEAMYYNIDGDVNTAIGYRAGYHTLGGGNVFLGNYAGYNEIGSNKLYISSIDTDIKDLIYGDFSTGQLGLGGTSASTSPYLYIKSNGNVGIGTTSPYTKLTVWGSGTGANQLVNFANSASTTIFTVLENGNVGIGTTSPYVKLSIYDSTAGQHDVVAIATGTDGAIFRIDSYGATYGDSAYTTGADYAEYFRTDDTDLLPGEAVCVDIIHDNSVERCLRGADNNVMGVVSTHPAIIGNNKPEYASDPNYKIIAMLGQIPAKVSAENGPIRPGDSLTPASSTPGLVMRAGAGDPTVGIALEPLTEGVGTVKVLISRRNQSVTAEMVEAQITERIAAMSIEDEVKIMIEDAIDAYDFDARVSETVNAEVAKLDQILSVQIDGLNGQILALAANIDSIDNRLNLLNNDITAIDQRLALLEAQASTTPLTKGDQGYFSIAADGSLLIKPAAPLAEGDEGNLILSATSTVAIVDIETVASTTKTAFVVNQLGDAPVADFQSDGVSIVNIADTGKVSVIGELMVDGRIMVCAGGACSPALDEAVDETMGDIGVEGTVVAGAFAGYCEEGYSWVPGSAKYGTMPGFCIESSEARLNTNTYELETNITNDNIAYVNISQGEASYACQTIGDGYHLITENEWLTIAENAMRTAANDLDASKAGIQLATTTAPAAVSELTISSGAKLYGFAGGAAEWTDQTVLKSGLPLTENSGDWNEYYAVTDYKGLNIAPAYYYSNIDNGIGRLKTNTDNADNMRGFVRGASAIYDLDLSNSPTTATSSIGFRCAK